MELFGSILKKLDDVINIIENNKGTYFSGIGTYGFTAAISVLIYMFKSTLIRLGRKIVGVDYAMGKHSKSFDSEFKDPYFKDQLKSFVKYLKNKIFTINEDSNWSSQYFTPLDAEVEVRRGLSKTKKVTDLLNAIRDDKKSRTFLILGDPGSGKSVSLKKLTEDLFDEVFKTNKIPLYVNLKEWLIGSKWSKENPPTTNELQTFILNYLKGNNDLTDSFLEKYFLKLLHNGHFFIILDSFDEIPMVLDEDENSWLIDKLSEVIFEAIITTKDSRGILASRFFRRPSRKFNASSTFYIRPFSHSKILQTLRKTSSFNDDLLYELFNVRTDLIPVIRNPFAASLFANYIQNNCQLPPNQGALYENYIYNKLNFFEKHNPKTAFDITTVLSSAKELAYFMFKSENLGLEIPIAKTTKKFGSEIVPILDIFTYARIGRIGSGLDKRFSFIHRRFNEYFVAQKLLECPELVPINSIPNDSRWRDALVLFCEVAPEEIATKIADFCIGLSLSWELPNRFTEHQANSVTALERMHCLRFLSDSFKGRKECLNQAKLNDLNIKISSYYNHQINLLEYKLAAEAIGLLPEEQIQKRVQEVLAHKSTWITETALNSCRHISEISPNLKATIIASLDRITNIEFLRNYKQYRFSFKLSNSFYDIYIYCQVKLLSILIVGLGTILGFIINPFIGLIYIIAEFLIPKIEVSYRHVFLDDIGWGNNIEDKTSTMFMIRLLGSIELLLKVLFVITLGISLNTPWLDYSRLFNMNFPGLPIITAFLIIIPHFTSIIFFRTVGMLKPLKRKPKEHILTERENKTIKVLVKEFVSVGKTIVESIKNSKKLKLREIVIILSVLSGTGGMIIYFNLVSKNVFILTFLSIGFIIGAYFTCLYSIRFFILHQHDMKILHRLKLMNKTDPWSRNTIEDYFYKFKTTKGRYLFVRFLYDENISTFGKWKEADIIPHIKNRSDDDASTLLAQLEERWLGLYR